MNAQRPMREPDALHQPPSWLADTMRSNLPAQFVALTMDVCYGVACCLHLLHADMLTRNANRDVDETGESAPLLSLADGERLLLLATAASRMLAAHAEDRIDGINHGVRAEQSSSSDTP